MVRVNVRANQGDAVGIRRVGLADLLGMSRAMNGVREFARRAARVNASVLIQGETGTGKTLVGRIIHNEGPRARSPFVAVNCAGIPESLFEAEFFGHRRGAFTGAIDGRKGFLELAHGGSLFLDEVGELPISQQAKLLTVLEEGEVRRLGGEQTVRVEVRVLTAASSNLHTEVEGGSFRRDLFHRLAVLSLVIPPLRERPEDIELLATAFQRSHRRRYGYPCHPLSPDALEYLKARPWPGNIRELSHLLEAALILSGGEPLDVRGLKSVQTAERGGVSLGRGAEGPRESGEGDRSSPSGPGGGLSRYSFSGTPTEEKALIRGTLAACRGNKSRAAKELGMARNTLTAKMREYRLELE